MTEPIEVSRKTYASFEGERWNAFIDLISKASLDEVTSIQRVAFLAWWYSSEVLNGGHDQYFGNKAYFEHAEVIESLKTIGAQCQSDVLRSAFAYYSKAQKAMPEEYDEFISWNRRHGYSRQMETFDLKFYDCRPEIETELLEAYLDAHESDFIRWVPRDLTRS